MDLQRGRSPSAGHQSHISHSSSPHQFQENVNSIGLGLGLDASGSNQQQQQQFISNGAFSSNGGLPQFIDNNEFLNQQEQAFPQEGLNETTYTQSQDFNPQFEQEDQTSPYSQQQQPPSFTQELLSASNNFSEGDFSLFSTPNNQGDQFDPQLFMNDLPQPGNPSVNPAELNMSSPPVQQAPTPPNLLQPDSRSPSSPRAASRCAKGPRICWRPFAWC